MDNTVEVVSVFDERHLFTVSGSLRIVLNQLNFNRLKSI
jgi:hypothetical protein